MKNVKQAMQSIKENQQILFGGWMLAGIARCCKYLLLAVIDYNSMLNSK